MGRPDYIFGQFRETARCRDAQHGDGVCCAFAPQLVIVCTACSGQFRNVKDSSQVYATEGDDANYRHTWVVVW